MTDSEIKLAVTICATANYQYAMRGQARLVQANLRHWPGKLVVILVGDLSIAALGTFYKTLFEDFGDRFKVVVDNVFTPPKETANYKPPAQLLIAKMRTAAFTRARSAGADLCWSLDSDVIPKTGNCFRVLRWILDIPGAYYEVAISPYPSQGGGHDLLCGRGTPENTIAQDYRKEERKLPDELAARIEALDLALKALTPGQQPPQEVQKEAQSINEAIQACPPLGNVFEMSGKFGWRRRGWSNAAYPGIGRGAIVPSDWCGMGSTLMSRRALDECDLLSYEGQGTEDLYIVWRKWAQVGIRIGAAMHEPSHHVSRRKDGKYFASMVRFVTDLDESKGECTGHIRVDLRPFYQHEHDEAYDPLNDGNPVAPAERIQVGAPVLPPAPAAAAPK